MPMDPAGVLAILPAMRNLRGGMETNGLIVLKHGQEQAM